MRALDRKLLRDVWQIKGQAVAIGLVIAAGVALFVADLSTFSSLRLTQQAYYDRYRFADVFASLKRAPRGLGERIAEIPGVASVETRVVVTVNLDVAEVSEPVMGRLIGIPKSDRAALNDVFLRRGRYLEPDRPDEVLVTEGFALARDLGPGDTVTAVINGRRRELEIVGVALSPEYVYTIRPGEMMPDDGRFGLFWMERKALATAYDMEGGFNDVALRLMPGASADEVIARLDRLLEPYGGLGAYPRALQVSHWYLESELTSLQGAGFIVPVIFLTVAAFLLNVVLKRIVSVQREQIAALKALGYSSFEIGLHYTQWSLCIAVFGGALGVGFGSIMGRMMIHMYNAYFRFPQLTYQMPLATLVGALVVCLGAGMVGAFGAVAGAVRLPPAEAMRPEPPASYKASWIEGFGLHRLSQPARMIWRNLQRRPRRALASVVGISFALAIMIVGMFSLDSIDVLLDVQFNLAQRQDITVSFVEPRSSSAFFEIQRLPGVIFTEPVRSVPARLRFGHRSRQSAITGLPDGAELQRVVGADYGIRRLPSEGLVLSAKMAEILGAGRGDVVTLEVLEGARPTRQVVVSELVEEFMGMAAYMNIDALRRLMREGSNLSGATLRVDARYADVLFRRLKAIPAVAGVALKSAVIDSFKRTIAEQIGLMIFFNVLFSSIISFGVVYNAARISLSERSRELASLRVIGLTRAEISFILLGELAILTLVAIPLGLLLGFGLAAWVVDVYNTELYRFPLVVSARTCAFATLTVLVAAAISGLVVRRKLDRLDLVEVLKTRE